VSLAACCRMNEGRTQKKKRGGNRGWADVSLFFFSFFVVHLQAASVVQDRRPPSPPPLLYETFGNRGCAPHFSFLNPQSSLVKEMKAMSDRPCVLCQDELDHE
jgi:hypothetical protein